MTCMHFRFNDPSSSLWGQTNIIDFIPTRYTGRSYLIPHVSLKIITNKTVTFALSECRLHLCHVSPSKKEKTISKLGGCIQDGVRVWLSFCSTEHANLAPLVDWLYATTANNDWLSLPDTLCHKPLASWTLGGCIFNTLF